MQRERHDPETVIRAIQKTHGLLAPAAELLGYDRRTLYTYVKRHQLESVIEDAREEALDFAEHYLWAQIEQGNLTAIIFFLKCLGKSRGYIERVPVRVNQMAEDAADPEADAEVITINVRNGANGLHG
jgi:Bacterial regulatory protein, Fis family